MDEIHPDTPVIAKIVQSWNRFWFASQSTRPLARFRIATCMILLLTKLPVFGWLSQGIVGASYPKVQFHLSVAYHVSSEGFYAPYIRWLPPPSDLVHQVFEWAIIIAAASCALGFFARTAAGVVAAGMGYLFFSSQFYYYQHLYLYILCFTAIALSPCDQHLAPFKRKRPSCPPIEYTNSPIPRLVQFSLSAIYLFNAISKTNTPWFSGGVIDYLISNGSAHGPVFDLVRRALPSWAIGSLITGTEYFLSVAIWWPRARRYLIGAGIGLHLAIFCSMYASSLSFQMIALYLLLPLERMATSRTQTAQHHPL